MAFASHDDSFWINDVHLRVAPTQISINNQSYNYEWQTLRTKSSRKTKSGHSVVNISVQVVFVGEDAINNTLRPLIAQLRLTPFCYVDNQYIRQNLFPGEGIHDPSNRDNLGIESIALAFRSAEITVEPDTAPITASATLNFSYFNYLPYTPYFMFKKTATVLGNLGVSGAVSRPEKSDAWKLFYDHELSKYRPIPLVFDGQIQVRFLEFRQAPDETVESLLTQERILEVLQQPGSTRNKFLGHFLDSLDSNVNIGRSIIDSAERSGVFDGGEFTPSLQAAEPELLVPILENVGPRYFASQQAGRDLSGAVDEASQEMIRESIRAVQQRLEEVRDFEVEQGQVLLQSDQFKKVPELSTNRGVNISVYKREREIELSPDSGVVVVRIILSIQNILATLPVLGHKYATFQHIGSMDAVVHLDMMVRGDEANRRLAWLYHTIEDNMLKFKKIPQGLQAIEVANDFLALLLPGQDNSSKNRYFLTQAYSSDTIPGEPSAYAVSLQLIESGLTPFDTLDDDPEQLRPEYVNSDTKLRNEIIKKLVRDTRIETVQNLRVWGQNGESVEVPTEIQPGEKRIGRKIPGFVYSGLLLDPKRNSAFQKLVREALPIYTDFLNQARSHVTGSNREHYFPLINTTEEQIPGITKVAAFIKNEWQEEQSRRTFPSLPLSQRRSVFENGGVELDSILERRIITARNRYRFRDRLNNEGILETGNNLTELIEKEIAGDKKASIPDFIESVPVQKYLRRMGNIAQKVIDQGLLFM